MRGLVLFLVTVLGLICGVGLAQAAGNRSWQYPCDVFMAAACFRLPSGMSVSYDVPADYGRYVVKRADMDIATIYAGASPNFSRMTVAPALKLDSPHQKLSAFVSRTDGIKRIDIFVLPVREKSISLHISTSLSEKGRDDIDNLLSGLRPCWRQSPGNFHCSDESKWGKAISDWINSEEIR